VGKSPWALLLSEGKKAPTTLAPFTTHAPTSVRFVPAVPWRYSAHVGGVEPRRSASVVLTREEKNVTVNGSSNGDGEAGVLPNRACAAAAAMLKFAGQTVAKGTVELRYKAQSSSGWEAGAGRA
jgi:hypothetical protein